MSELAERDDEAYKKQFSKYIKLGIAPEQVTHIIIHKILRINFVAHLLLQESICEVFQIIFFIW